MWICLLGLLLSTITALETPPTPEAIGHSGWTILHTTTIAYPDNPTAEQQETMRAFFSSFAKVYPCASCSVHFQQELADDPPQVLSRTALAQWLCGVHNRVNLRLGKPAFPCEQVFARWDPRIKVPQSIV